MEYLHLLSNASSLSTNSVCRSGNSMKKKVASGELLATKIIIAWKEFLVLLLLADNGTYNHLHIRILNLSLIEIDGGLRSILNRK